MSKHSCLILVVYRFFFLKQVPNDPAQTATEEPRVYYPVCICFSYFNFTVHHRNECYIVKKFDIPNIFFYFGIVQSRMLNSIYVLSCFFRHTSVTSVGSHSTTEPRCIITAQHIRQVIVATYTRRFFREDRGYNPI